MQKPGNDKFEFGRSATLGMKKLYIILCNSFACLLDELSKKRIIMQIGVIRQNSTVNSSCPRITSFFSMNLCK